MVTWLKVKIKLLFTNSYNFHDNTHTHTHTHIVLLWGFSLPENAINNIGLLPACFKKKSHDHKRYMTFLILKKRRLLYKKFVASNTGFECILHL